MLSVRIGNGDFRPPLFGLAALGQKRGGLLGPLRCSLRGSCRIFADMISSEGDWGPFRRRATLPGARGPAAGASAVGRALAAGFLALRAPRSVSGLEFDAGFDSALGFEPSHTPKELAAPC